MIVMLPASASAPQASADRRSRALRRQSGQGRCAVTLVAFAQPRDRLTMSSPVAPVLQRLNQIILGKEAQLKLVLACLLARGHLLIEDIHGMGKTTLALALARALGLHLQRVQLPSDLLPADHLGVSVFEAATSRSEEHTSELQS